MREPSEPTVREKQVANLLGAVSAIFGFAGIVLVNVTHTWWPVVASGVLLVAMVVTTTIWVARSRQQRAWATFVQIAQSGRRRA